MKKLVVSVFLFLIAAASFAQKNTGRMIIPESNLEYQRIKNNTEVEITGFTDDYSKFKGKVLEVPSKIQGYPVTTIKKFGYVWSDNGGLWIPDCVNNIGRYAFQSSRFPSIRLPDGLTTIDVGTFRDCYVKSVVIPASVKKINASAFSNSNIESISIPTGCTIYSGEDNKYDAGPAFYGCNNLKTIIFPAGTVYFATAPMIYEDDKDSMWSPTGIFKRCNNLESVVMPKGFVPVYISKSDFKDYNLLNYIQGDKIKKNFKLEDTLRNTKVRNAAVVYHEAYLDAYNKAMKSGNYENAKLYAAQYKQEYSYYQSSEWTERYYDAAEKPYLDAYNKAFSSKDYDKAMQTAKEFKEKNIRSSAWSDRYNDAVEKPYLDEYNKAFSSKDYDKAMQTAKEFKEKNIRSSAWSDRYNDAVEKPYLDEYNKAFSSKDYDKAMQTAKDFREKYSNLRSSDWRTRYTDAAEKTYLESYDKAMAAKDWEKAKSVINEFSKKISSDSSLSSLKSKWDDMLFDVDCKMYLPAYVEKLEQKGSFEKIDSKLKFKIPLDNDLYKDSKFNFTDSEGNELWTVRSTTFLSKIKKFTGKDYSLSDNYGNPYLYRNPTDAEAKAYHQVRKDAVKIFMDGATKNGVMEKDNFYDSIFLFIYLGNDTYSSSRFIMKDSSGNVYALSEEDFLGYVKEVSGIEYKLNRNYYGNSYIYRNATDKEIAAYHQVRKDAVKLFLDKPENAEKIEMNDKNLLVKIYLGDDTYSSSRFTMKDSSGNVYALNEADFLSYVKEVSGIEYKLNRNYYGNSYIYRNATDKEIAAYYQSIKDAVKLFMDGAENTGKVEKDGSNILFKMYLGSGSYSGGRFIVKDQPGNTYTLSESDFLGYAKEVCGTEYKLYGSSSNPYLYRNATDEEIAAYHQVRKDAVKLFLDKPENAEKIEMNDKNLLVKIYLGDDTYSSSRFTMKDSSGNVYALSEADFLSYVKEVSGIEYKLNRNYYGNSYIYRNATDEETSTFYQSIKDSVKLFMDGAAKNGVVEKNGDNFLLKIYLGNDTYSYRNDTFTVKDSSGNAYMLSDKYFLDNAKEVCGTEYKLYATSSNPYLYRNATADEIAAYNQVRKDAVKLFMDGAVKNGVVEKDGANHLFKIYLSDSTYNYSYSKFTIKDSSGKEYMLSNDDFLSYAKEVCGTEYNLYYKYNGSYLYRNATEEETDTFYKSRKEAIKIFMDNAVKNGTIKKDGSNLIFKFYLSDSIFDYHNGIFTVKDSKDKTYTLAKDDFLSSVKEICGIEYDMYWTHFSDCSFLFRNATAEEAAAYHQPKIDALKPFLDDVVKSLKFEEKGSNLMVKIYLPYLVGNSGDSFYLKDSSGKEYTVDCTFFLSYVKEIYGVSYNLYRNGNNGSYLYRNATDEEISAYQQPRKDAVKQFMDRALNVAVIEKDGSNFLFKIYLADDTYNSSNGLFGIIDSSGNEYILSNKDFLAYAKEVCGTEYKLGYYRGSCLYRNATDEEISAYQQPRKDAVKQFMDRALNVAVIEKDGSNSLLKIYLADDTYSYGNDSFYMVDSSGNKYTMSDKDFLAYAKEVCGTEYKLHGYYSGSYLYRNATTEEIKAYYQVRKDAVKQFMERAVNVGKIEKDGSNLLFKIYLSESTYNYRNSKFTIKDSSGNAYTLSNDDFLSYAKETSGIDYKLYGNYNGSYLYAKANDMLQLKCVFAFQNGNLHTNLVYKLKDKWEFPVEFAESNGTVTIKSFKVKKSVFEENGLKTKDVVKKIVVSDAYGNETEIGWKDLPNVQAPSTLLITVVRGSGKKAQTYIFKVPVEWDVNEMKSVKDILDFKCILAFKNGTLHTNLACNVDGKWMYVAEFVESKGEVIIKSFRTKKSVLERVGLKTKDIIKKVVLIDDSENEIAVVNNLFEIQAPATLRFTIERGSGKKAQTMIFDVPVEWNEDEVKNLR